jgi:hypothetical protein
MALCFFGSLVQVWAPWIVLFHSPHFGDYKSGQMDRFYLNFSLMGVEFGQTTKIKYC